MSAPWRQRRHGYGEMSVQVTPLDRRPQAGGKIKRQRIAKSLLDLNEIIRPPQTTHTREPSVGNACDPVELLEGAIEYIKVLQDDINETEVEQREKGDRMQEAVLPARLPSTTMSLPTEQAELNQVLTGFQDCTEEVMRYLIEVENLPESHPVCQGLRQHLFERERLLNVESLLNNCQNQFFMGKPNDIYYPVPFSTDSLVTDSSLTKPDSSKVSDPSIVSRSVPLVHLSQPKLEDCSAFNLFRFLPESSSAGAPMPIQPDSRLTLIGQHDEDQSKLAPTDFRALDLQQLAENNPEIACLTEEILGLLEEDDDDDDMSVFDDSSSYIDSDIEP